MGTSVFEKIKQRVTAAATSDGPQPDVAPASVAANVRVPLKMRVAKVSAAFSHVTVIGLAAIAVHTRPDILTAFIAPTGPKALPLEASRPVATLPEAKRVPLQTIPATASLSSVDGELKSAPAADTARKSTVIVPPVARVAPPTDTEIDAALPRTVQSASADLSEAQLKALPLTFARSVILPEARLLVAAAAKTATLFALPMSERSRDVVRDNRRMRTVRVRERAVTDLETVAVAAPIVAPVEKAPERSVSVTPNKAATASKPAAATTAPPLVKWAAMTPEQRAEANAPVKKSAAYTVTVKWTDDQIAAARAECAKLLKSVDLVTTEAEPVREGACGAPAPVNVSSVGNPKVQLHPTLMTCPMAAALDKWMTTKVQPAAKATFGAPVARLISASSYSCRNRYGSANTPLSEHGLVNALDLAGFILSDGRTVRVKQDWGLVARDAAKKPIANSEIPIPTSKQAPVKVAIAVANAPSKAGLSMLGGTSLTKKTSLKSETKAKPHNDATKKGKDKPSDETTASDDDQASGGKTSVSKTVTKDATKTGKKAAENTTDAAKPDSKQAAAATKDAPPAKDITVLRREFLHRVHADACDVFGTVLGPEANDAHRDHFHLDMKARRHRAYCQ